MPLKKGALLLCLMLVVAFISSCSSKSTQWKFQYNNNIPNDYSTSKLLYINEDIPSVTLDGTIAMASGEITIQVIHLSTNQIVWSDTFTESASFPITLLELQAEDQLSLQVEAKQITKMNITLEADNSFVKEKEKPSPPSKP